MLKGVERDARGLSNLPGLISQWSPMRPVCRGLHKAPSRRQSREECLGSNSPQERSSRWSGLAVVPTTPTYFGKQLWVFTAGRRVMRKSPQEVANIEQPIKLAISVVTNSVRIWSAV